MHTELTKLHADFCSKDWHPQPPRCSRVSCTITLSSRGARKHSVHFSQGVLRADTCLQSSQRRIFRAQVLDGKGTGSFSVAPICHKVLSSHMARALGKRSAVIPGSVHLANTVHLLNVGCGGRTAGPSCGR